MGRMKLVNQAELRRQVGSQAKVSKAFLATLERRLKAVLGEALERLKAEEEAEPSPKGRVYPHSPLAGVVKRPQGVGPGTLLPEHLVGPTATRLLPEKPLDAPRGGG